MVVEDPPQPLGVIITGKGTTLSEATVSVELNRMENCAVEPEAMSLDLPPDEKPTVDPHDPDQFEGGVTEEHCQSEPDAGVEISTSFTVQPLPLYRLHTSVLFTAPLETTEGITVTE
jgi:hypothetical protein